MKVLALLLTTESEEPLFEDSFIEGYESAGGTWAGTFTIVENISADDMTVDGFFDEYIDDDYELCLRNTGAVSSPMIYEPAQDAGMFFVNPVGSNFFEDQDPYLVNNYYLCFCGSGVRGEGNATAYPCVFYDASPLETAIDISNMNPGGVEYDITHIKRLSDTQIQIKLSGVSDTSTIAYDHGIPFTISNLDCDILPLPSGVLYTPYAGSSDIITLNYTSTSGTGSFVATTGTAIPFGTADELFVKTADAIALNIISLGINIQGVAGFTENPNGNYECVEFVNNDGFYDKFKIDFRSSGGAYTGGGSFRIVTQSYATPYIAGQLAYIKDALDCSWSEAYGRAMTTASNYPQFDEKSGYGYIDVASAIAQTDTALFDLDLSIDVHTYDAPSDTKYQTVTWSIVPFAEEYEIWYRGELLDTVKSQVLKYTFTQTRGFKETKNYLKVRAKTGDEYGEFSNLIELPFYKYRKILAYDNS